MPEPTVAILGIGSAVPRLLPQSVSADLAVDRCADVDGQRAWLHRVYDRVGVEGRGSVLRLSDAVDDGADMRAFYFAKKTPDDRGPTTAVRMQRYATEAPPLAERASRAALENGKTQADAITHLITVSCTGFFAPGLDAALIQRLGLRSSVIRTHIGFMGCHAAPQRAGRRQINRAVRCVGSRAGSAAWSCALSILPMAGAPSASSPMRCSVMRRWRWSSPDPMMQPFGKSATAAAGYCPTVLP